jgi:glycosyltransferase involved in cell wall biosynthesis
MPPAIILSVVFWSCVLGVLYAYFGYPLVLYGLSVFRQRAVQRGNIRPTVSLIIAAHNEEARIRNKLENTRRLEYPRDRLQVLVASDCSSDGTDRIVEEYRPHGVELVRSPARRGKEAAQQRAIEASRGEILVFSDVGTLLEPDAIATIVSSFADPTVGCVSSVDRILDDDGRVTGENAYVRYEMLLRSLESRVNSLVGLSGSFFAARREVSQPWRSDLQSDFNTLLNSVRKGLRGVSDPHSIGYYRNIASESREFHRKVRTVVRGIAVFMNSLWLLNPIRHGLFAWQLVSHKLCRWLVPWLLLAALLANLLLLSTGVAWRLLFLCQCAFYAIGLFGMVRATPPTALPLKIPFYFLSVNVAVAVAWVRYLSGERFVVWQPSQR